MQQQQIGNMISKNSFLDMVSGKALPRIEQMEDFTRNYPWCAIGHKMFFKVLCTQSDEAYLSYVSKVSAYLFNKEELFLMAHAPRAMIPIDPEPFDIIPDLAPLQPQPLPPPPPPPQVVVVAGGDYFSQSILDTTLLSDNNLIDTFIKNKPKITSVQLFQEEKEEKVSLRNVGDDNFMTETLAKIYADQFLYQQAIEAYQKLILLYPKKSDYFASLIKEVKSKMNR